MPGNLYLHTAYKIKSYVPFLRVFCLRGKEYRRMAKELSEGLLCARFLAEGEPWIREENCIRKEKRITHYGIYLKQSIVSIQVSIWYHPSERSQSPFKDLLTFSGLICLSP